MGRHRRLGLFFVLLGGSLFVLFGTILESNSQQGMLDFHAVYTGAQCALQHKDPYRESDFLQVYFAGGGTLPADATHANLVRKAVAICINLPTTLFLVSPFALLSWEIAHLFWGALLVSGMLLAAYLMWRSGAGSAPLLSGCLAGFLLANSEVILGGANTAGMVVSSSVIAAWCFLTDRFAAAGVVCLAVALVMKPHDAGVVWLFFLLSGGRQRTRALQALVVAIAIALPSIIWMSHVAPHWLHELRGNLAAITAPGNLNDTGPASLTNVNAGRVLDLQSIVSVFLDRPVVYNALSYAICGILFVFWAAAVLRSRKTLQSAFLGLATAVPLTMLATYHRPYDAKLLLMSIPACAMLWRRGGFVGRCAVAANALAIFFTADIPLAVLVILIKNLHAGSTGLAGMLTTILLERLSALSLLTMALIYVWVYLVEVCRKEDREFGGFSASANHA